MKFTSDQIALLNDELPAVAVAGPWGSGKSLFCLTRPTEGEIVWLHTEPSGANYAPLYKANRLELNTMADLRQALGYIAGRKDKIGHIIIDTVARLEQWIYDDVVNGLDNKGKPLTNKGDISRFAKDNAAAYGEVKNREAAMLAWLKAQAPAVSITAHLRTKYVGKTPTPNKEPRTKEVVYQFVSLFLSLERNGASKPAGHVLKTTLLDKKYFTETGEPKPVLPPKLPVADWATIWKYIETPVDLANLAEEETSNTMSDEEALRLMAAVASGAEVDG
jgi:hypothetical protein